MINPFAEKSLTDQDYLDLVQQAKSGNKKALEELVLRHQAWIYNIAVRMVYDPELAKDITQEILIKMMTRLKSFKEKSSFRTWLYRIVVNHVIDMKRSPSEKFVTNFSNYGKMLDEIPNQEFEDTQSSPADMKIIVEETRICCLSGMLVCLDRESRLCYIIGSIFGANDKVGSAVMDITRDNFRKKLSRARKKLTNFVREKCSLMDKNNPCNCRKKIKALIEMGYIDPDNLLFNKGGLKKVNEIARKKSQRFMDFWESKCDDMYRDMPFQEPPTIAKSLKELVNKSELQEIYELADS
jgi:RNA polymerase sigma factor (sigma-70 family)